MASRYVLPTGEEIELNATQQMQMRRMAQSRRNYARRDGNDRYRPIYHYVNPEGFLNDPNGLCFWQGRWHLFYQAYPPVAGMNRFNQHWGHCYSEDLIHWHDLPLALAPGPETCCFSGTCFVEEDRVIAMYHGLERGNMVAVSTDPLLVNWEKLGPVIGTQDAVIPIPERTHPSYQQYSIFDPCIWKQGDFYYSASGGQAFPSGARGQRSQGVPAEWLFRSRDLREWEFRGNFLEGALGAQGDDGACPYFWPIGPDGENQKYILCYFSHRTGGKYMLGEYITERERFRVTSGGNFNFASFALEGGHVHAPSAFPDPQDCSQVLCIFNMNSGLPDEPLYRWTETAHRDYAQHGFESAPESGSNFTRDRCPSNFKNLSGNPDFGKLWDQGLLRMPWDQIMSLPRVLSLSTDAFNQLYQRPCDAVASLHTNRYTAAARTLNVDEEVLICDEFSHEEIRGDAMEIDCKIELAAGAGVELCVLRAPDGSEGTKIVLEQGYPEGQHGQQATRCTVVLDGTSASTCSDVLHHEPERVSIFLMQEERLELQVFMDKSIVEVFVNRRQCVAMRVYPVCPGNLLGISLRASHSAAQLASFEAWDMQDIFAEA